MATSAGDPLPEAIGLCQGAAGAGLPLKLLGGLGVRVLCPDFPPRLRAGQDIDLACLSKGRSKVAAYLEDQGCQPDRRFNGLNGDRQMYFTAPSGRPVDVMVDRLAMCHTLDFRAGFGRLPVTLDAADLLLSKLQIVELNFKDAHDIVHLLAGLPLSDGPSEGPGAGPGEGAGAGAGAGPAIDTRRFGQVLAADWGWWRTVTSSLGKLPAIVADRPELVPPHPRFDPVAQAKALAETAESVPKSMKWRVRARVGDRARWYELPEEVAH